MNESLKSQNESNELEMNALKNEVLTMKQSLKTKQAQLTQTKQVYSLFLLLSIFFLSNSLCFNTNTKEVTEQRTINESLRSQSHQQKSEINALKQSKESQIKKSAQV